MHRNKSLICPNCGREAQRLLTPPLPPRFSLAAPQYQGLLCERCLHELTEEYSVERFEVGQDSQQEV